MATVARAARTRGPQPRLLTTAAYGLVVLFCVWSLVPIVWALLTSLKPDAFIMTFPPTWWPEAMVLEQYEKVLASNMPRYFLNSVVVAALAVLLTIAVASHGAYAVARFEFAGKNALLFLILSTMMVARLANIVPLYLMAARLGLLDTHLALVLVYSGWQVPIIVWLLRDFFASVPPNLDRAALMDGYGRLAAFYRVTLPLARPGLAAAAILVFVYVWNDFIIAVTLTSSEEMRLVSVGLYMYVSSFGIRWGELMAAVMLSLLPVLATFLLLQRHFVSGMTSGAIKG